MLKSKKANNDIRTAAKNAGVFLYQVAKELNISESGFICKLRYEVPQSDKEQVLNAIQKIAQEQKAGAAV